MTIAQRKNCIEKALEQIIAYCEMIDCEVIGVCRKWDESITGLSIGHEFFAETGTGGIVVKTRQPESCYRGRLHQVIAMCDCHCALLDKGPIFHLAIWAKL